MEALRALGWDPEGYDWDVLTLDDTDLLKGREAVLVLEEEEYEGTVRVKVRFVNAPMGAGIDRLEPEEAKAFAVTLRGRLMKVAPPKAEGVRSASGALARPEGSRAQERATPRTTLPSSGPAPALAGTPPGDLALDDIPF